MEGSHRANVNRAHEYSLCSEFLQPSSLGNGSFNGLCWITSRIVLLWD